MSTTLASLFDRRTRRHTPNINNLAVAVSGDVAKNHALSQKFAGHRLRRKVERLGHNHVPFDLGPACIVCSTDLQLIDFAHVAIHINKVVAPLHRFGRVAAARLLIAALFSTSFRRFQLPKVRSFGHDFEHVWLALQSERRARLVRRLDWKVALGRAELRGHLGWDIRGQRPALVTLSDLRRMRDQILMA